MRNILDYGAIGDGVTSNTKAIQAAIDAGGTVYVPEGVFVTGTIHLKSHGGIYLAQGAVLKASHDHSEYNAPDYCPQNLVFKDEFMAGTHLISAIEQEDIVLAGFGTIEGDSHHWVNESRKESYCDFFRHPSAEANRPGQMVFFAECKDIKVQDIHMHNAPFWHLFFHGCEDVQVRGITIKGERRQWVNDGIDIDCCKRVTVSDCLIDTGDDAITLRAVKSPLLYSDGICENVTVTNCILTSYLDYAIRIGVGSGLIRDCSFSNVIIKDSYSAIGITCRFTPESPGVSVENISFSNFTAGAHNTFQFRTSNRDDHPPFTNPVYIKNISVDGFTAYCDRNSVMLGFENSTVSDITFRNMQMNFIKEDPENDRFKCNWVGGRDKNAAFYLNKTENITFENVKINIAPNSPLTHTILAEKCENVNIQENMKK